MTCRRVYNGLSFSDRRDLSFEADTEKMEKNCLKYFDVSGSVKNMSTQSCKN